MNLGNKVDVYAALSYIAGGGLVIAAQALAGLVPKYATQILGSSGVIVGVAGLLVRLWKNPTTPPPPSAPKGP